MADNKYPSAQKRQDAIKKILADGPITLYDLVTRVSRETGSWDEIPHGYIRWDIRQIRLSRKDGGATVIVRTRGYDYLYELTDDEEKVEAWVKGRTDDADARVETMMAVAQTAVDLTAPSTLAHKRARLQLMHLGRLKEDLEALKEAMA